MYMRIAEKIKFNAKILLLGEYSIIRGGQAITVPLKQFSGYFDSNPWGQGNTEPISADGESLKPFIDYLKQKEIQNKFSFDLDLKKMQADVCRGLIFHSNIPRGYGAGSSGALVAAVFASYLEDPHWSADVLATRYPEKVLRQLSVMESFFHGNSSGLDPMSCLMARTLWVDDRHKIQFPPTPLINPDSPLTVFLLDTREKGDTKPLVDWFNEQAEHGVLNSYLLKDLNDALVKSLLLGDLSAFESFLLQLSLFQLENMKPMVPQSVRPLWIEGLETMQWTLKICGSGGGGYMLGFTHDYSAVEQRIKEKGFELLKLDV